MANTKRTRDRSLAAKAAELQSLLEKWAEDSLILQPGERLVFSLRIEGVPTVVRDVSESLWDMSTGKFFDRRRLEENGVRHSISGRIHGCIRNLGSEKMTMRDFLTHYSMWDIRKSPYLGPKCRDEIVRVLAEAGMTLKDA